ncbi:MAG: hypothetical protein PHV82_10630 [Victivallaceae bacterium]|nr:hypothetical protein [Victivallaceae bacterium]
MALSRNHRLCANSSFTLDMIENEPLILFPRAEQPQLRDRFDECFRLAGIKLNIIQELSPKRTTLAFVPESSMIYSPPGVKFRYLRSDLPDVGIFALRRAENEFPLIKNFFAFIPRES